ncbi:MULTISPECIES: acyl-CoA thioesterase [unclassified Nocardioides]|uniref:acyl-CoA thioesterase n=1 Tax=unclassified Nocardioides TaxID=2615069 RepID=UPI00361CCCE0
MPRDADELLELLDLERIDDDLYRGAQMPTTRPMVFGGQVAAQSLVAASRTVEGPYTAHSLHSYFLQPGDPSVPTIYDVEKLRDGRSFLTRRVIAQQHGRPIYAQTVNFHLAESGLEHQESMPDVPGPDDESVRPVTRRQQQELHADQWNVADIRLIGSSASGLEPDDRHPARQRVWLRVSSKLPDEPFFHQAAFTYLSDMTLVGAAMAPHGVSFGRGDVFVASLDHAVWFHRPFRADEWWLYDQVSPSASSGRGLVIARVFGQDGSLVASVAQEAVLRPRKGA